MLTGSESNGWDISVDTPYYLTFRTPLTSDIYTSMCFTVEFLTLENILRYDGESGSVDAYTYSWQVDTAKWTTDTQRIELISVENISPEFAKWFRENFTIATDNPT